MKTYIIACLAGFLVGSTTFGQNDTIDIQLDYDLGVEHFMLGVWYRHVAVYPNQSIDSNYKKYEFFPDNRIQMTEVINGYVHYIDYAHYFVRDTVLYLVTDFRDTSIVTDAVTIDHLDSTNFVVNSFFEGPQYHKTTFGRRLSPREIPPATPIKQDEEIEMPGFAEKKAIIFS